ncbi:hypothetical protein [Enterobacter sp. HPCN14]|uniref:hypothetical protein n=1 Tax=Enterobacter sp. HPCN14 TaxID=2202832 RepID=UPI00215B5BB2|nr:hypothetical protein [Enterobacter sp. HPCN14]
MSLFDKKLSLMPVVIASDVWQSAVEFPADPQQVEERLGNLLLAVLLTLRTAGTVPQESHLYDLLSAAAGRYESPCRITAVAQLSRPLRAGLDG